MQAAATFHGVGRVGAQVHQHLFDLHRVEPESIRVPTTLIGVTEDQLVPISDMRELRDRHGGNCSLVEISSIYGHDAFLKETEVLRDVLSRALD